MDPYSSILAWRIPWTGEPGGLRSMEPHELDTAEHARPCITTVASCLKLSGLNNINLFSYCSGGQKSKIWVTELHSFWKFKGRICFVAFSSFRGLLHALAHGSFLHLQSTPLLPLLLLPHNLFNCVFPAFLVPF